MIKRIIPSFFTCLAILAGCAAIVSPLVNRIDIAGYLILLAAALDYLDGMFARLLNAKTEYGKQLDSLADIVSFGIAPAVILFHLLHSALIELPSGSTFTFENASFSEIVILCSSFLITVFAALRLAKFNIGTEQEDAFKGLPTPAVGIFIAVLSITFHETEKEFLRELTLNLGFLLSIIFVFSVLMVSNIRMFSLKMKSFALKDNLIKYLFLICCIVLVVMLQFAGLGLAVILYIILSLVSSIAKT